jgi:hypothetical protein
MKTNARTSLTIALLSALAFAAPAMAQPIRDGSGEQRVALNKMELKPFPHDVWSKLSDWQNGELAEGLTKDKVVLVLAYNDFSPAPKKAMALAKKLAAAHGSQGLIVVAAHAERGWTDAEKPKVEDGSLHLAHDAKGEFRKALLAQSDPDWYLIDRAGQMRFAGVATESVEEATKQLLAEDAAKAGGTQAALDAAAAAKDAAERKARAARESVDLTKFPELPFTRPDETEFSKANWPKLPRDPSKQQELVYIEPKDVALPDTGWFPSKPSMAGKIVVLYFWHPDVNNVMTIGDNIDNLARQNQRDVLFVGVVTDLDGMNVNGVNVKLRKDQRDVEKLSERMAEFVKARQFDQYFLVDGGRGVMDSIFGSSTENPFLLALLSSDGKARWWGDKPVVSYEAAFARMLQIDPGVQARRKAEDAWLNAQKAKKTSGN